jgi:O-antigen ligase
VSQSSGKAAPAHAPGGIPERALEFSLAGLLVMLPFSHTTAMIRLLLAVGLAAAVALAWRHRGEAREPLPAFALPFLAWALWCVASLAWSVDPGLTASELRAELFYVTVTLFIVRCAMARGAAERVLLPAAGAASVALGALALFWALSGIDSPFSAGAGYISSTVLVLFPVGCVALMAPGLGVVERRIGMAMVVALLAAGLTTFNRTLGPALALEVVLVAVLVNGRAMLLRRLAWVLAAGLLFAALQAGVAHVARFTGDAVAVNAELGDPRPAIWSHVTGRIAEAPLTGRGYGRDILAPDLRSTFANPLVTHAHNIFLDAGLQLGIPGMVLLAALFASVAWTGFSYARSADPVARACGTALVALVAGTVTRNLSDDLWVRQNALLFWIVAAALAGLAQRRLRPAPAAR